MEVVRDRKEWLTGWGQMLVGIWHEKILRLQIYDTGNLYNNVTLMNFVVGDDSYEAEFSYPEYGIYVERGTGKEFPRGNFGDLGFTPIREPQLWYSPKFYASFMKLKEFVEVSYGSQSISIVREALSES